MKRLLTAIALAAAALSCTAQTPPGVVLSFTPSTTAPIAIGEQITVRATISGLGSEVLSAYDLNYLFNPGVLNWNWVEFWGIGAWNEPNQFGVLENGFGDPNGDPWPPGNLGMWLNSLQPDAWLEENQDDSFDIALFSLTGAANGTSQFTLGDDPDLQRLFVGLNALPLNVNFLPLCIAVGTGQCQAPEPGSLALVGAALLAAWGARRRSTAAG
jgi:hypothetical protein